MKWAIKDLDIQFGFVKWAIQDLDIQFGFMKRAIEDIFRKFKNIRTPEIFKFEKSNACNCPGIIFRWSFF